MSGILKLEEHDEERERDFDLEYLRSLSVQERFRMVLEVSTHMAQQLLDCGYRKPFEILKRP